MSTYHADPTLADNTCNAAETTLTIEDAIEIFGEPNDFPSDKTSASWVLELDGVIVTLYDWKGWHHLTVGSYPAARDAARDALRRVLNDHRRFDVEIL